MGLFSSIGDYVSRKAPAIASGAVTGLISGGPKGALQGAAKGLVSAARPPLYKSVRRGKRAGRVAGLMKAIAKNPRMSAEAKKKALAKLRSRM